MSVSWTDNQLDAIRSSGRAVIVSAAAGSGKTAVLVEKLLRILSDRENPVPADRIVVVTFTNDAAEQMKQRLSAALAEASEKNPSDTWLISQQALIPSAKISTIHSFCFNLIRENSSLLDVDSGFRVLDAAEDEAVNAKAVENVLDRWYEERAEDMTFITDFFSPGASGDYKIKKLVPKLSNNILALPFPDRYMDKVTANYENPPEFDDDPLIEIYSEHVVRRMEFAYMSAEKCLEAAIEAYGASASEQPKIQKLINMLKDENEQIKDALEEFREDPCLIYSGLVKISFDKAVFNKKISYKDSYGNRIEETFDEDLIEEAKFHRENYRDAVGSVVNKFTYDDIRSDYMIHGAVCRRLFDLLKEIFEESSRLKKEKNALGFSDAEQLTCRLLCNISEDGVIEKSPLAKELSDYYSIVMIDEFQDSTAVQELIFRMISKGGTAGLPGTNLFSVGDVKQSIYRFRCADPRIFMNNLSMSVPYSDDGSDEPAYILLNRNFRSSRHVVGFVNNVFGSIMSCENGGIDYGEADSLVLGAAEEDDFGPTEILDFDADADTDSDDEDAEINPADASEAECTARKIRHMLDTMTIHEKGVERRLRPSDFCILLRNNTKTPVFVNCLEKYGIKASGAAEDGYLESAEISVLLNLLRSIDNPTLDIPMAAVMMSSMFMFSAEDMGNIRLKRQSSLYADAAAAAEESSLLGEKCRRFLAVMDELREYAAAHSLEELIVFIYDKTDFLAVVSVYKNSARKKANLRLLPIYAAQYDKNGTGGLNGFVRQINNMIDNSKDFEAASSAASEEEAVQIKTIHRSKGLEYPFVFLCGTRTKFNMTDVNSSMVFVSDYGVAFRITDAVKLTSYESFPRCVLSIIKGKSTRDEEMMLLYVALTRAKNKIFITRARGTKADRRRYNIEGLLSAGDRKQITSVSSGISMGDWLDAALALSLPQSKASESDGCTVRFMSVSDQLYDSEQDDKNAADDTGDEPVFSSETADMLSDMMTDSYDLTLSETASKLTVSEISKSTADYAPRETYFGRYDRRASAVPLGMTSAQAGTAVHAFMQYADLHELYASDGAELADKVRQQAAAMAAKGLITPAQAACVHTDTISAFLKSSLCDDMLKSGEIYREKKFLIKICDLMLDDSELMVYNNTEGMLQGVADCVFREDDHFVLVDYKTDRHADEYILKMRYSRQLALYARALSLILDSPVTKGYIYSFELGRAVEITL